VFWSIVVKEKQTLGSPFFGAFCFDRIHKAKKDANVHLFIHSFTFRNEIPVNFTSEFWELLKLQRSSKWPTHFT
jgi:hypothetical protein